MTLTEFLLARIAEDKATARNAEPYLRSLHSHDSSPGLSVEGNRVWSVQRALADCEAKRKVVEEAQRVAVATHQEMGSLSDLADHVLTHLALPYADHPDYRPEWKP